jgi:hypothetical protein
MKEFIYEVKNYGVRIAIGNWMVCKGANLLKAKRIRLFYEKK